MLSHKSLQYYAKIWSDANKQGKTVITRRVKSQEMGTKKTSKATLGTEKGHYAQGISEFLLKI